MTASLLGAALWYAEHQHWPVFPCIPNGKAPLTRNGFKDATTNTDVIRDWWRRWPDANLAFPTGAATVDVLDVDHKPDLSGWDAFHRVRKAGLLAGALRLVSTPSGGGHLYFKPSGVSNHTLARFRLDTRGDGGYVVAPPSAIDGVLYRIEDDHPNATGTLNWNAIKEFLDPTPLRRPSRPLTATGADRIGYLVTWIANLTEGNRNAGLYWACNRALDDGEQDLTPLIDAAVLTGIPQFEADRTADSARRTPRSVA